VLLLMGVFDLLGEIAHRSHHVAVSCPPTRTRSGAPKISTCSGGAVVAGEALEGLDRMAGLADFNQRAGDQVGRAGVIALVAGAVAGDAGDFGEGWPTCWL